MGALCQVPLRGLHELPDHEHHGRCAISGHVILGNCCPGYHDGRGVLDLHLPEQDIPVLGQLDGARAVHQHLNSAPGPQIRLHDVVQALSRVDVHEQRGRAAHCSEES